MQQPAANEAERHFDTGVRAFNEGKTQKAITAGTVGDIKVAKSSGYQLLDRVAQNAVQTWRHISEPRNGRAVARRATLAFRWKLE